MTIFRGPGGTGSATSDSDTTEFQEFLVQSQAARDAALAAQAAAASSAAAATTSASTAASASRLTAGTTITGAPGSSADVSITGSAGSQVLNLTIPRGDGGPTGPQGPAGQGVPTGGTTGQALVKVSATDYDTQWAAVSSGSGDVGGPASSTDNAIARFDGTTGKLVQNSPATVDDDGNIISGNIYMGLSTRPQLCYGTGGGEQLLDYVSNGLWVKVNNSGALWRFESDGSFQFGSGEDCKLYRDASQTLAQRNGTNPQTFRIYNTYTDGSNYERGFLKWNTNVLEIGAEKAGTGSDRNIRLVSPGGKTYLYGSETYFDTFQSPYYVATYVGGSEVVTFRNVNIHYHVPLTWGTDRNTADVGFNRDSAGIVKITNGSTGLGSLKTQNLTLAGSTTEGVFTITDGASVDLNPASGTIQVWTLGASRSPTATGFSAGQSMTLMIDDGTAYTITWPSVTWKTDGGVAPTLNTTGYTAVQLWKVDTVLYGARVGDA